MKHYFKCERCGEVFDGEDAYEGTTGVQAPDGYFEPASVCPECGSDDLAEVGICIECGAPVDGEVGDDCVCDSCIGHFTTLKHVCEFGQTLDRDDARINPFFRFVFSDDDINEIIMEYLFDTVSDNIAGSAAIESKIDSFVEDNKSEFIDFIKEA